MNSVCYVTKQKLCAECIMFSIMVIGFLIWNNLLQTPCNRNTFHKLFIIVFGCDGLFFLSSISVAISLLFVHTGATFTLHWWL